jgi:hypothetical protein
MGTEQRSGDMLEQQQRTAVNGEFLGGPCTGVPPSAHHLHDKSGLAGRRQMIRGSREGFTASTIVRARRFVGDATRSVPPASLDRAKQRNALWTRVRNVAARGSLGRRPGRLTATIMQNDQDSYGGHP